MTIRLVVSMLLAMALAACSRAPENKEAVRAGIMEHLSKNSGLDLGSMEIEVNNVSFQGSKATALVSFKPKSSPDAGMSMNYTLERQGVKWVVQKAGSGSGHTGGAAEGRPDGGIPIPPAGASPESAPGKGLPPGHPPVGASPSPGAGAPSQPPSGQLPPGHPPVGGKTPQPSKK